MFHAKRFCNGLKKDGFMGQRRDACNEMFRISLNVLIIAYIYRRKFNSSTKRAVCIY